MSSTGCLTSWSSASRASTVPSSGQVRQTLVEMDHAFLFVTAAGYGACLALLADESADVGMVAYEMNMMVKRVGAVLTAKPRDFMERPVL
jgi:predicted regulator of Ras-like GTPase activity (Roadblock/LC7/MglB family)